MRTSQTISALSVREAKAWKVIDWAMSKACTNPKVKYAAAAFVLERLYAKKVEIEGRTELDIKIQVNIEKADENTQHILQAPRFSVSSLQ